MSLQQIIGDSFSCTSHQNIVRMRYQAFHNILIRQCAFAMHIPLKIPIDVHRLSKILVAATFIIIFNTLKNFVYFSDLLFPFYLCLSLKMVVYNLLSLEMRLVVFCSFTAMFIHIFVLDCNNVLSFLCIRWTFVSLRFGIVIMRRLVIWFALFFLLLYNQFLLVI